jgi:hypothetical protein
MLVAQTLLQALLFTYTESKTHKGETMPTKLIINCETGEQTEVELTAEENAQREKDAKAYEVEKKAKDDALAVQAKVKADVLKRLGLTEDETKALLS